MSQARHDRLSELLIEALDLEETERQDFLDRLRQEEPDLVGEVAALIDVDQNLETSFLAKPVLEDSAVLMETESEDLHTTPQLSGGETPHLVGPYRLLKLLGAGGMGKVFLAHQEEPIRRKVALKLVRSSFRDLTARARFEAERQLLAQVEHPNIGRILDAGATDDGFPFFALELVDGEPLTEYCDQRSLTLEERLRIMIAVCRGVEHAHRKQIIHRDLKPSNILVAEVDGKPVPKIIDFGIAKSLNLEAAEGYEEDGELVVGTPAFMSPEAMDGSDDIDTRTDVYSLGVLLYLLAAGRRPFDGEVLQELVFRVTQEDPPPPSRRISAEQIDAETATRIASERKVSWSELRRRLRGDLDWILIKATARSREDRYGSASALGNDLERYLGGFPVRARPSSWSYRFGKWARRNRGAVVAGALLSILGIGLVTQGVLAERRTERLTRASEELTREVERTEWRMRVANLLPIEERRSELDSIRKSALRLRSRVPELYAGAEGPAEYALGRSALSLGELDEARSHLESAWRLGYQRPEVALALGTTLGLLYERNLDAADRGPDAETRRRLRQRAEQELRAPALERLALAETDLTLPDLINARIAFYRDDLERALNGSRAAFERRPSLFEAKFLEARILQRMSGQEEDQEKTDLLLEQSIDAARQGLDIARSSFDGHLRLCQVRVALASHRVRYSRDGIEGAYRTGVEACSLAQTLAPGSSEVGLSLAGLRIYFAEYLLWDRAVDPAEPLNRARDELLEVSRGPDASNELEAEVQRFLGRIFTIVATYHERSGQDPMAAYSATIEHLQKAQELQPGFYFVSSNLAHIFSRRANHRLNRGRDPTADIEQSIHFAQTASNDEPGELLAHIYLAQGLVFKAEYDAKRGRSPQETLERADAAVDRAQAIERRRIAVLGTLTAIRMIQGTWKLKTGVDPTEALEQCVEVAEETLEHFPEASFPHLMSGQCRIFKAIWEALHGRSIARLAQASRDSYSRGFEKLPDMPGPQTELALLALTEARLEMQLGRSPIERARQVIAHAEKALELDDERPDAVRLKAEAEAVIAVRLSRDRFDPVAFEEAEKTIGRAIEDKPELAEHQLALAEILWMKSSARPSPVREEVDRGLAAAEKSLEIDRSDLRAEAIRGALLTLYPETEAEGRRALAEAVEKNPGLAWTWRDHLP